MVVGICVVREHSEVEFFMVNPRTSLGGRRRLAIGFAFLSRERFQHGYDPSDQVTIFCCHNFRSEVTARSYGRSPNLSNHESNCETIPRVHFV